MPVNGDDSREQSDGFSRRTLVKSAGALSAGSIVGLAGCTGNGNGGDGGDGGDGNGGGNGNGGGGNGGPSMLIMFMDKAVPSEVNFNPWNGGTDDMHRNVMFDYGAGYHQQADEWYNVLTESWEWPSTITQGNTLTINIHEDFTWHDGADYTATDFVGNLKLLDYFGDPVWDFISGAEAADDKTAELTLSTKVDPLLLEDNLFGGKRWMYRDDIFGEDLQALEEASTEEEQQQVMSDLTQRRITGDQALDMGLGCGPAKYSDADGTRLVLDIYDDYSNALGTTGDDFEYDQIVMKPIDTPQQRWQAIRNKEADVSQNASITNNQVTQLDQNDIDWINWIVQQRHTGRAITWNTRRKPFDNRKVRWALAYAINRELMVKGESYGEFMLAAADIPCGMSNFLTDKWLGDRKSDYMKFGKTGNREKATQILEEEGFTKGDQWWQRPNGETFQVNLKSPPYFQGRSQHFKQTLETFGVKVKIYNEESTTYEGQTVPNHTYDALHWWQGQVPPIPQVGYTTNMVSEAHLTAWPKNWDDDASENSYTIDVPPIGEPEGDLQEVDVQQLLIDLGRATSEDEKRPLLQKIAWVYNWNQDKTYDVVRNQAVPYTTDDWEWPSPAGDRGLEKSEYGVDQNPHMRIGNPQFWPIRAGFPKVK
ncbi:ABC transporter substrate-binding protein [Halosimplex pelagicum]|uniref:Solute-binding protein family 5 domain-containing protein n=1 Tax=Halosimplex pelagicum TaxID=869886 RepID=A0A7D5T3N7_9EURY|nr:ABC transporter substrate-binding protein [Halosimplex pelagicum]QLH82051.1 hypothetical protein HZS54_10670 [Halosimplex pelagicum]